MHTADIITSINMKVFRGPIQIWRIGVTNDPVQGKRYWTEARNENTGRWSHWEAESLWEARDVESLFISKGMKSGGGAEEPGEGVVYVYVF